MKLNSMVVAGIAGGGITACAFLAGAAVMSVAQGAPAPEQAVRLVTDIDDLTRTTTESASTPLAGPSSADPTPSRPPASTAPSPEPDDDRDDGSDRDEPDDDDRDGRYDDYDPDDPDDPDDDHEIDDD